MSQRAQEGRCQCPNCRLLEGLQAQLGSLVEQLSMPLALLPGSNLLLEAAPDLLSHQLSCVPGDSAHAVNGLLCQALSLSRDAVPGNTDDHAPVFVLQHPYSVPPHPSISFSVTASHLHNMLFASS